MLEFNLFWVMVGVILVNFYIFIKSMNSKIVCLSIILGNIIVSFNNWYIYIY